MRPLACQKLIARHFCRHYPNSCRRRWKTPSGRSQRAGASPLCDSQRLAVNLEQTYVAMFERWFEKENEPGSKIA